jgi:hypothetical protein
MYAFTAFISQMFIAQSEEIQKRPVTSICMSARNFGFVSENAYENLLEK